MLKLIGKLGKFIIVDAIHRTYKNSVVYSYDNYLPPIMGCYHVDCTECSIEEFCNFVYYDVSRKSDGKLLDAIVIYTELVDITEIEKLAVKLENNGFCRMVVVTGR